MLGILGGLLLINPLLAPIGVLVNPADTFADLRPALPRLGIQVLVALLLLGMAAVSWHTDKYKCKSCNKNFYFGPIEVKCPKCGRKLNGATSEMIGDTGVCPNCKHEFEIRDASKQG